MAEMTIDFKILNSYRGAEKLLPATCWARKK